MNEKLHYNLPKDQNLTEAVRRAIEYEQRIALVESVCAALNDSRTGPEPPRFTMTGEVNRWLVTDPVVCKLTVEGSVSLYSIRQTLDTECQSLRGVMGLTHNTRNYAERPKNDFPINLRVKPLLTRGPPQHLGRTSKDTNN